MHKVVTDRGRAQSINFLGKVALRKSLATFCPGFRVLCKVKSVSIATVFLILLLDAQFLLLDTPSHFFFFPGHVVFFGS